MHTKGALFQSWWKHHSLGFNLITKWFGQIFCGRQTCQMNGRLPKLCPGVENKDHHCVVRSTSYAPIMHPRTVAINTLSPQTLWNIGWHLQDCSWFVPVFLPHIVLVNETSQRTRAEQEPFLIVREPLKSLRDNDIKLFPLDNACHDQETSFYN